MNIEDQLKQLADALGETHDVVIATRPKGLVSEMSCSMHGEPEALSRMIGSMGEHLVTGLVLDVKKHRKLAASGNTPLSAL